MRSASFAVVLVVAATASGCLGGSSANAPTTSLDSKQVPSTRVSGGGAAVLDAATRKRLLAEWRVAVKTAGGGPGPIVFLTPRQLVPILNRINRTTPATTDMNETLSLDDRIVFVLPDSNANRLDIATAAADGRYVHLIAVNDHRPQFKFAPL